MIEKSQQNRIESVTRSALEQVPLLDLEEEAANTSSSSSTPEVTLEVSSSKYSTRRRAADSPQNSKYTHAESPQLDELDSVAMRRIREDSSSGAGVATDSTFSAILTCLYKGSKAHRSCELNSSLVNDPEEILEQCQRYLHISTLTKSVVSRDTAISV